MSDREALAAELAISNQFTASQWLPFVDAALAYGLDDQEVLGFGHLSPGLGLLALASLPAYEGEPP